MADDQVKLIQVLEIGRDGESEPRLHRKSSRRLELPVRTIHLAFESREPGMNQRQSLLEPVNLALASFHLTGRASGEC